MISKNIILLVSLFKATQLTDLYIKKYNDEKNLVKISEEVIFNPNDPYSFHNPLLWAISANCSFNLIDE